MSLSRYFPQILLFTGAVTMLPLVQFLAPAPGLRLLYKLELTDEAGRLFAQHWGLLAAAIGALLLYASGHPELQQAAVAAALVEKAALAGLIFASWSRPFAKGLRLAAVFDTACSLVYAAWLLGR